jgi:hypothetical protein
MSLYESFAARPGGGRAIAKARLQRAVLRILDRALILSAVESQSALANRLHIRKSAVSQVLRGDGNVRISTLADYLYELGFEANLELVNAGELRRAVVEGRQVSSVFQPSQDAITVSVTPVPTGSGVAAASQSACPVEPQGPRTTVSWSGGNWFPPVSAVTVGAA